MRFKWWLILTVFSLSCHELLSQTAVQRFAVTEITDKITLDGELNESVWKTSPTIGALTQRQPNPGTTPTERTDVTLLRDADFIYIGVVAYDSEPDKVIGTNMARDAALRSEDSLEIIFDTFRDQQSAFYFATNSVGALVDGLRDPVA